MKSDTLTFALKRIVDVAVSLAGLALLTFPFALIVLAIKLDSRGPVFHRLERIGKGEKPFLPFKFRTMVAGAVHKGLGYEVSQEDARITRVGRVLRNWGLDELPQLINVLKGEMSIVGPRPTFAYQVAEYNDLQRRRLLVKPGVTGLALVHGRNSLPWEERIRYDVWYVDHLSLWLDIKIMLKTLIVVLVTREGLYGEGGVNQGFVPPPANPGEPPGQGSKDA